ncbi:MAG: ATP-binding protein [Bacteroidota bacterium]
MQNINIILVIVLGTALFLFLTGGMIYFVAFAKQKEINIKKKQIEELSKSERKYRGLFENSLAGIARLSFTTLEVLDANTALLKMFGVSTPEALQSIFERMPKADDETFREKLLSSDSIDSLQTSFHRNDGTEVWVLISAAVVPAEDYIEAVILDITEKKRFEVKTLRTQRMESIGLLAGSVAHDLQNMLAPLKLSVDFMHRKVTDERLLSTVTAMTVSIEHGLSMVRQLLSFVRGVEGTYTRLDLVDSLQRIVRSIEDTIPNTIRVDEHYEKRPLYVNGDETQLRQVFSNLINNARDAMAEGGILTFTIQEAILDASKAKTVIDGKAGQFILCTVSDTGTGIPSDKIDKIFDPSFTTKEVGKGTGLGLSIVSGIIKGHKGFIDVESTVGKGTTFFLFFPAVSSSAV